MTERDYSEMSPQQLNAELKQLYEHMPVSIPVSRETETMDETLDEIARVRKRLGQHHDSEHKGIVMKSVSELAPHFKGSPYFNDLVLKKFSLGYDAGIDKENGTGDAQVFEILLDIGKENSGGIFDEKRVRFIEYIIFEWELRKELSERVTKREFDRNHAGEVLDVEEDIIRNIAEDDETYGQNVDIENGIDIYDTEFLLSEDLQKWITDYTARYPLLD